MAQGPSGTILVAIQIILRIRESKVRNLDPPDYSKNCKRILKKFFAVVGYGPRNKWHNFGDGADHQSASGSGWVLHPDPPDYSKTCEWILTKFFVGVEYGSRTKRCNFSCSAEVCAVWVLLVYFWFHGWHHFWPTVLSVEPMVHCVVCLSVVCDALYCGKTVRPSEKLSEGVNRKPGGGIRPPCPIACSTPGHW